MVTTGPPPREQLGIFLRQHGAMYSSGPFSDKFLSPWRRRWWFRGQPSTPHLRASLQSFPCGQWPGTENRTSFLWRTVSGLPLLCRGTACRTMHYDQDFDRENRETACFLFHSRLQHYGNYASHQDLWLDFRRPLIPGLSSPRDRSMGSFPEQRLVIEPSKIWILWCSWQFNMLESLHFNPISHFCCLSSESDLVSKTVWMLWLIFLSCSFNQRLYLMIRQLLHH